MGLVFIAAIAVALAVRKRKRSIEQLGGAAEVAGDYLGGIAGALGGAGSDILGIGDEPIDPYGDLEQ